MPEVVLSLDQDLFRLINSGWSNAFFDFLMPLLRNRYLWIPLYVFLGVLWVWKYQKTGWLMLLFFGLTFAISDYTSASIIKPAVERLRPCNEPAFKDQVNLRVDCGTGLSFPSAHATNHFALGIFLIVLFYRRFRPIIWLALAWAISIGLAQIYVGVHYPGDILGGAILGSLIGLLAARVFLSLRPESEWKPGN